MTISYKDAKDKYWKYYISLEKQFIETGRYVEFDYVNNGKTYSMEYMKIFQIVCSEIDVIGKIVAALGDNTFVATNTTGINEWWFYVTRSYPELIKRQFNLFGEITISPWDRFVVIKNPKEGGKRFILDESISPKAKTPKWWNDYNSAKHNRTGKYGKYSTNYAKANLRNIFIAFSALYSLEVLLMTTLFSEQEKPISVELESKLFDEDLPFYTKLLSV